jgi:hypothetical protein
VQLLGAEPGQATAFRHPLGFDDFGGGQVGVPDGPHLARAQQVGQRAQRLLDVGAGLGVVELVEVEVVDAEAAQGPFDGGDDPAPGVAAPVRAGAHRAVALGGEDDVVAAAAQGLPDDPLAFAVAAVDVGGVDGGDAVVEGPVDDADARVGVGVAVGAEHHRAQGERAHLDAGPAEGSGLQRSLRRSCAVGCAGGPCIPPPRRISPGIRPRRR